MLYSSFFFNRHEVENVGIKGFYRGKKSYLQLGLTWWSLVQGSNALTTDLTWYVLVGASLNSHLYINNLTFCTYKIQLESIELDNLRILLAQTYKQCQVSSKELVRSSHTECMTPWFNVNVLLIAQTEYFYFKVNFISCI